ncbi:MAG: tetratricopeptide repeat protein [Phycisphaerales bacterium]
MRDAMNNPVPAARLAAWMVVAMVLGAGPTVGGCAGTRGSSAPGPSSMTRTLEANRLAILAQRAQRDGETDLAIDLYRQSLAESADDASTWNNLGALLLTRERYLEAVEACKRAADLSPTDPRPLYNIGHTYATTGWQQKAMEYYLMALERDGRDLKSLRGAIGSGKLLGVADESALERIRTALMLDTDPDWRKIHEGERTRIEGELNSRKRRASAP